MNPKTPEVEGLGLGLFNFQGLLFFFDFQGLGFRVLSV